MADIVGFGNGSRTTENLIALRAGMRNSVKSACLAAGIPWAELELQDTGDGILILAPGVIAKSAFAGSFLVVLAAELRRHNETHPLWEQIKLRLALHAGEVTRDETGTVGISINRTQRLLDAGPLKKAIETSSAPLAVIVSDWYYDEVVRQGSQFHPEAYRKVSFKVKETRSVGWIRLPGHDLPAGQPAVTGEN